MENFSLLSRGLSLSVELNIAEIQSLDVHLLSYSQNCNGRVKHNI